uniref:ribosomal protein L13 n=1 Tax=Haramonas pauciplastida TaxID=478668 RepID=UPI00211418B1|nr:ribosomal protein L13 [Haramonas pauciplastida]UTE94959.1 ribosomal protein L13 [Haramonas pauciplastida]
MSKLPVPSKKLVRKKWYLIDAKGQNLGRLAVLIANLLRGKFKLNFTPHLDLGDYVIIINSKDINVTGKKFEKKLYRKHSGRPGGLTTKTFKQLQNKSPNQIIEKAVKGMLPKGPLGRELFRHLKVYDSNFHYHQAQNPIFVKL